MRIIVLVCAVFFWAGDVAAQRLDPASLHILISAARIETSEDLAPIVADAPDPILETVLWTDAIDISKSPLGGEPAGRMAIARLMEAALIHAGIEPDLAPLDKLSPDDISAMQDTVGFPDGGDLLLYLMRRGPSLRDSFEREGYTAIRHAPEGISFRVLQEQSDRTYLGIEPEFGVKLLHPKDDPVFKSPHEYAKTRRLNLAALPEMVLAAKAFRAAGRTREDQVVYPLLVAVEAVNRAFLADQRDFRPVLYYTELKLLKALRAYSGTDPFLLDEARRLEFRRPRTAFFARFFEDAAVAYASAPVPPDDRRGKVGAAWGEALSLFAYGADAGPAFERVVALVEPDTRKYAEILRLFLDYLPAHEAARLGDVAAWRARVAEVLGSAPIQAEGQTDLALGRDFAHLMATIGRPDIASRFLMNRIRAVKGLPQESQYLLLLAPFIRDYCHIISFQLSPAGSWIRREPKGYDVHLDFLDNFNAEGQLVGPGEVVVSGGNRSAYPTLNPEEDCAVILVAYGVVDSLPPGWLIERTSDKERAAIVSGFEAWAREAASRKEPSPSIVPYLKLVWLDWFAQAFEALKNPTFAFDASKFRYNAIDASTLATPERVRELLRHEAATPDQKNLIHLFLEAHLFLEEMYP